MANLYLILKCVHILGVISWMAGLLYYFRLFVYHFDFGKKNESIHSLLSIMEKRLYQYITLPAMVVSIFSGLFITYLNSMLLLEKWFQVKLIAGLLMTGFTLYGAIPLKRFRVKRFQNYSSFGLRVANEIPTLLMIIIVIMVIVRPF